MNLKDFIEECRQRTIFRSISIYVVSAWVIIQVAATTFPHLGLPEEAVSIVIILALIGFPLIMIFSWFYNVVPEQKGNIISLHPKKAHPDQIKDSLFKRVFFGITSIVAVVVLIIIGQVVVRNFINSENGNNVLTGKDNDRIAVLTFHNNTGDQSLDIIGEMAADRIAHSITQNKIATVVSNDIYNEYSTIFDKGLLAQSGNLNVQEYLDVKEMITGNYYLDDDRLLIDCNIVDARDGRIIEALETIQSLKIKPLDGVERLRQAILGYLVTAAATPQLIIETRTPNFDAYRHFLMAKATPDLDKKLTYLDRAITLDSNYFEPKLFRLSYYYNLSDYKKVDSLYSILRDQTNNADERQLNLLSFYASLLKGNNRQIYNSYLTEFDIAPFDMPSNLTMMVLALQFINLPEKVIEFYDAIPNEGINLATCSRCQTRSYVRVMALLELGKYDEAILLLEELLTVSDAIRYSNLLIQAFSRQSNWTKVISFIERKSLISSNEVPALYLTAAKESILLGNVDQTKFFLEEVAENFPENMSNDSQGEFYYYNSAYKKAILSFKKALLDDSRDVNIIGWLAACYYKLGDVTNGKRHEDIMLSDTSEFQFGGNHYALARIELAKGNSDKALLLLRKSVAEGIRFRGDTFQNDPYFVTLHDEKQFSDILTYWH